MTTCCRCSRRFDPEKGRGGIYLSEGGDQVEQIRNMRVVHVCPACCTGLRQWLGLPATATPNA